jgi:hypothetical protein
MKNFQEKYHNKTNIYLNFYTFLNRTFKINHAPLISLIKGPNINGTIVTININIFAIGAAASLNGSPTRSPNIDALTIYLSFLNSNPLSFANLPNKIYLLTVLQTYPELLRLTLK